MNRAGADASRIKAAIVCPTIGQTRRGYERYFTELFAALRSHADITLFKGAGPADDGERVVGHITRTGALSRLFPDRLLYPRYLLEFGSFAICVAPLLAAGGFDLVHFIDPPLARSLHIARRLSGGKFRLLFSNARPEFFDCSRWADHIHCLAPPAVRQARELGVCDSRLSMIPVGVDCSRLALKTSREELRRKYGVPLDRFVALSVTTLNRAHKRVDHLIEEASLAGGEFLLWIDGSLHPDGDPTLVKLAAEKLGNRFRRTHVPSENVAELLKLADVFVSSAVVESFGMAIVEAMASGLPVITHDSPHFRWLTGGRADFVDMTKRGDLAALLRAFSEGAETPRGGPGAASAARRFEWSLVAPEYLEMYRRAVAA